MSVAAAYLYIRFATPEQAQGCSESRQIEQAEKYCREHTLRLDQQLHLTDPRRKCLLR
jgi:DNA invertase Pin-like site-specific DNA recombinase